MAIQEQLDILQQGTGIWNKWRAQHQQIPIDLIGADLRDADLDGAHLDGAHLDGADLRDANLIGAHLSKANLRDANLSRANLRDANLSRANLSDTDLNGANLSFALLRDTNLSGANLSFALLSRANLSFALLRDTNLRDTNLRDTNLSGADLRDTDLSFALLSGADLSKAKVGRTTFGDIDLRTVKGLETIDHYAPSTIGTNTLERSEGHIPGLFLKKAGLSDTFIAYVRSLVQSPIQYYTCFISYSSQNQDFTERLYADLQSKGVRCWFAPEDLKIGEHFPERIEEAIRFYDKLLVILSEHSIHSSWVEDEVRAAQEKEERFKQEQHLNKIVLFPIKIDATIDKAPMQWAARLRRQRHIGNFTDWKHHDSYQKAFQRLLRDLQQAATKDETP